MSDRDERIEKLKELLSADDVFFVHDPDYYTGYVLRVKQVKAARSYWQDDQLVLVIAEDEPMSEEELVDFKEDYPGVEYRNAILIEGKL